MKKLDNKGLTLVELLISIVLIGIVLTFLVKLLSDLRNEMDNNDYAYGNQVNKSDALYTIQKDLNQNEFSQVIKVNDGIIRFIFDNNEVDNSGTLKISQINNKNYIQYIDSNGKKYKWEMKGVTMASCASVKKSISLVNGTTKYYFIINLPLYTNSPINNSELNNPVDDFELSYSGYGNFSMFNDNEICY